MKRRCIEADCSSLTERTRCAPHQRAYMLARGYTNEYRLRHIHARKTLAPLVAAGAECCRCGEIITGEWDADERPDGKFYPACRSHNRSAGARGIA